MMRYSIAFAGALLLAMSTSLFADAIRDAGSKVRGEWLGSAPPIVNSNPGTAYRAYSVAPSVPAPVVSAPKMAAPAVAAPAPTHPAPVVAQAAPPSPVVRSYSYAPAQIRTYSNNRAAVRTPPYLRADHKILGQYGD